MYLLCALCFTGFVFNFLLLSKENKQSVDAARWNLLGVVRTTLTFLQRGFTFKVLAALQLSVACFFESELGVIEEVGTFKEILRFEEVSAHLGFTLYED